MCSVYVYIYIIYICTHIQRHYPYLLLLLLVSWHLSLVTSWPKEVASLMADCSNDASTATTFSGKFHELSDIIIGSPVWWQFCGEMVDGWVEAAEAWWKIIFSKRFQKKSCPYEGIIGLELFENLVSARLMLRLGGHSPVVLKNLSAWWPPESKHGPVSHSENSFWLAWLANKYRKNISNYAGFHGLCLSGKNTLLSWGVLVMNIFDMMFGEEPAAGQAITLLTKTVTDFQEASGCFGCIRKLQEFGAVNFHSIAWRFCGIGPCRSLKRTLMAKSNTMSWRKRWFLGRNFVSSCWKGFRVHGLCKAKKGHTKISASVDGRNPAPHGDVKKTS